MPLDWLLDDFTKLLVVLVPGVKQFDLWDFLLSHAFRFGYSFNKMANTLLC